MEVSVVWCMLYTKAAEYSDAVDGGDDRRRPNATTAIGLDETSFAKLGNHRNRSYATTVADVANHQIIQILRAYDQREGGEVTPGM